MKPSDEAIALAKNVLSEVDKWWLLPLGLAYKLDQFMGINLFKCTQEEAVIALCWYAAILKDEGR